MIASPTPPYEPQPEPMNEPISQDRSVVLITGFGPFPSVAANATMILLPRIADAARKALPGVSIATCILPTEWEASQILLDKLVTGYKPTVALHFGVSGRASGFEIETRARNRCSHSEDAAGCLPQSECLSPNGPEYLPATLPAMHIVDRLRRLGLSAQVSRDAGGYLCNALLYRSLQSARHTGWPQRCGFVHLPASLVNARRPALEPRRGQGLDWQDVVVGSVEIAAAALGRPASAAGWSRLQAQFRGRGASSGTET